jgi:hypothetical protein
MEFANATKLHRKFGEPGAPLQVGDEKTVFPVVNSLLLSQWKTRYSPVG